MAPNRVLLICYKSALNLLNIIIISTKVIYISGVKLIHTYEWVYQLIHSSLELTLSLQLLCLSLTKAFVFLTFNSFTVCCTKLEIYFGHKFSLKFSFFPTNYLNIARVLPHLLISLQVFYLWFSFFNRNFELYLTFLFWIKSISLQFQCNAMFFL